MRSTRSNKYGYPGHYLIFRGLVDGAGGVRASWMVATIVGPDALEIKLRSAFSEGR
jgi:hypothetical protein